MLCGSRARSPIETVPGSQRRPQQLHRVRAERQPGRRVVADHRLPRRERPQRRRVRHLERQRELRPVQQALARRRHPELPQRRAPRVLGRAADQRVARPRPREPVQRRAPGAGARREVRERAERPALLARGDERLDLVLADAEDEAEAEPHDRGGRPADAGLAGPHGSAPPSRGRRAHLGHPLDRAQRLARVDVRRAQGDPAALGLVGERVRRVEAHRLLVEQRAQELRAVVHAQPGRLVGEQAEGGAVGLREAEAREADDHAVDALGDLRRRRRGWPRAPSRKRWW